MLLCVRIFEPSHTYAKMGVIAFVDHVVDLSYIYFAFWIILMCFARLVNFFRMDAQMDRIALRKLLVIETEDAWEIFDLQAAVIFVHLFGDHPIEKIGVANEIGHKATGGGFVNFDRRANLLQAPSMQNGDAIA